MSLPAQWVEKIFAKLTLTYGRDFLGRYEGVEMPDLLADWGYELAAYARCPEAISYALENLPAGRPPNVQDFKALASRAPLPLPRALAAPRADPARLAEELAKLQSLRNGLAGEAVANKSWARRLLARADAGDSVSRLGKQLARQALGQ
jgi:hypothetical protein